MSCVGRRRWGELLSVISRAHTALPVASPVKSLRRARKDPATQRACSRAWTASASSSHVTSTVRLVTHQSAVRPVRPRLGHNGNGALPARSRIRGGRTSLCRGMFTSKPLAAGVAVLVGLLGTVLLVYAFTQPPMPRQPGGGRCWGTLWPGPQPQPSAAGTRSSVGGEHLGVEDLTVGPVLPASEPLSSPFPGCTLAHGLFDWGWTTEERCKYRSTPLTLVGTVWAPRRANWDRLLSLATSPGTRCRAFSSGLQSCDAVMWWRMDREAIGWRCSRSRMWRGMEI